MPSAQPLNAILDLYRRSFPLSERRADDAIVASIESANYQTLTANIDGVFAGFALLFAPVDDDFALLEYLAIDPAAQGRGIGGNLVRDAMARVPDRHVLFEVEAESLGEDARRRQQFYRRCGCTRIEGLQYQLPLPNDPPPMELMVSPADPIDANELIRWLRRIFTDVYGCAPNDSRLLRTISDLQR